NAGFDGYMIKSEKDSLIDALLDVLKGKKYFPKTDKEIPDDSIFSKASGSWSRIRQLTPREIEIAKLIVQDYSNREIGEKLFIAEGTVETHRKHIKEKLKYKNRRDLEDMLGEY